MMPVLSQRTGIPLYTYFLSSPILVEIRMMGMSVSPYRADIPLRNNLLFCISARKKSAGDIDFVLAG